MSVKTNLTAASKPSKETVQAHHTLRHSLSPRRSTRKIGREVGRRQLGNCPQRHSLSSCRFTGSWQLQNRGRNCASPSQAHKSRCVKAGKDNCRKLLQPSVSGLADFVHENRSRKRVEKEEVVRSAGDHWHDRHGGRVPAGADTGRYGFEC